MHNKLIWYKSRQCKDEWDEIRDEMGCVEVRLEKFIFL